MQGVFISYRRLDSQSAAGRLADHLRDSLSGVPLFRDVETIEAGVDFVEAINRALESCAVLLAVIGPRWSTLTDASGRRRLDDPNDYTRLEIVTALQRNDVRVIPVLVEGATMPASAELPADLQPLCRRNAIELTDKRWEYDVTQLKNTLTKALGIEPPPAPHSEPRPEPRSTTAIEIKPWYRRLSTKQWIFIGAGVGLVGAAMNGYEASQGNFDAQPASESSMPAAQATIPMPGGMNNSATLTGYWQDLEGGQYQVVQQGQQLAFQGTHPYGAVVGSGTITGTQMYLYYTINGVPYSAALMMNRDGSFVGRYGSNVSGASGNMALHRAR